LIGSADDRTQALLPAEVLSRDFEPVATLLKAVADPYRLTMLATLAATDGGVCVCDFTDAFPLNQPTVSHHLRILRDAALVTCERRGTWVYYRLAGDARERINDALASIFDRK
jgi:DNA-binding transcriptional ArsR family regulator